MVLPIHDDNPVRRTPVVTYALIVINVVVFLLTPASSLPGQDPGLAQYCKQQAFFREYAAIPREVASNEQLRAITATGQVGVDPQTGRRGCIGTAPAYDKVPALSVLFAMFLHGGWAHLLGNMLFLFVFGNNIEDRLGRLGYLVFYLGCGYAATYAFSFLYSDDTTTLVGASGAIAGVLGAYLVLFPRARVISLLPLLFFLPVRIPAWLVLGSWFVLQYFYFRGGGVAQGAGVAYFAHVAGFVVGAAFALLLPRHRPPPLARQSWA